MLEVSDYTKKDVLVGGELGARPPLKKIIVDFVRL